MIRDFTRYLVRYELSPPMKPFKINSELLSNDIYVLKYQDRYVTYDPVSGDYRTTVNIKELNFWDWQVDVEVYSSYERQTYDITRCKHWESQYLITGRVFLVQKLCILLCKFIRRIIGCVAAFLVQFCCLYPLEPGAWTSPSVNAF